METTTQNLPTDVATLQSMVLKQQAKIESLTGHLHQLIHKTFGPSTEKYHIEQSDLFFDEAESALADTKSESEENAMEAPAHTRKKAGRVALPKDLPRIEVIHDLSDEEKVCDQDGHALHKIGEEVSEQLEIIPAKIQVIKHIRYKYACRHCEQIVKTAGMPKQPIAKSMASPGILAHIAVSKYQDALPLYRQEQIIRRCGIALPRATLANWMIKSSELLTPLINLMREQLLSGPLIHMDETPVQVLKEPDKTARSKSYMWVQVGGPPDKPVRLFDYRASRSAQAPLTLLENYQGLLMTDGYEGYKALSQRAGITQLACWAHARRKFMDAHKAQKKKTGKAQMALSFIQKLYAIEAQIKYKSADEKHQTRQQQSKPVIEDLEKWLTKSIGQVTPTSALGKALHYLSNQWLTLVRYLDHGDGAIDNNPAENAIRPFVVGRKNWLFSNSIKGANASAVLYSIIETAKANGLEPFAYLQQVFKALPNAESVEQVEALLPWNVSLTE